MTGPFGSGIVVLDATGRAVVVDEELGPAAASVVLDEASVVDVAGASVVPTAAATVAGGLEVPGASVPPVVPIGPAGGGAACSSPPHPLAIATTAAATAS